MVKKYAANSDQILAGKRLRQILRKGVKLQSQIDELISQKKDIEAELLGLIATFEDRDPTDSIELVGPDNSGKVTVTWNYDYKVDHKKAEKLREKMGDKEFFRCFSVTTSYSRSRSQKQWIKEAHGKLDRFKSAIQAAATKVIRKNPTIKWITS